MEEDEEDEQEMLMKEERVQSPIDGSNQMIYKSLWISENDESIVNEGTACDVCLSHDDDEGDEIVMCDGCNLAVHQKCNGREILH